MSVKIFRWLVIASIVAAFAWIKVVRNNDLAFGRDAEYLTNVQMRNLLNRFDAFCIDFDQATSSCTSVSRPTRVDERLAQFEIFTLLPSPEAGTYLKIKLSQTSYWQKGGLCDRAVSDSLDRMLVYASSDPIGLVTKSDVLIYDANLLAQLKNSVRLVQEQFITGDKLCELYKAWDKQGNDVRTYKAEYYDEDSHVRELDAVFSMFKLPNSNRLKLRPNG